MTDKVASFGEHMWRGEKGAKGGSETNEANRVLSLEGIEALPGTDQVQQVVVAGDQVEQK